MVVHIKWTNIHNSFQSSAWCKPHAQQMRTASQKIKIPSQHVPESVLHEAVLCMQPDTIVQFLNKHLLSKEINNNISTSVNTQLHNGISFYTYEIKGCLRC